MFLCVSNGSFLCAHTPALCFVRQHPLEKGCFDTKQHSKKKIRSSIIIPAKELNPDGVALQHGDFRVDVVLRLS